MVLPPYTVYSTKLLSKTFHCIQRNAIKLNVPYVLCNKDHIVHCCTQEMLLGGGLYWINTCCVENTANTAGYLSLQSLLDKRSVRSSDFSMQSHVLSVCR